MRRLTVELGARSYPILIGPALLGRPDVLSMHLRSQRVAIISNDVVAPLYLEALAQTLRATGARVVTLVLPDGEQHKDFATLNLIYDALLRQRCDRSTALVALGGGVIGDLVGFAAATYQRGVAFIQVPTTLLAQVDSSVGGKTGINHPSGKNMIGAFWQPRLVLADTQTLDTLPERELRAGLAEVIKYGLIRDPLFFAWLEANMDKLLARDIPALTHAIERSCANKAEVVAADETESNLRATLNLGHTFGHAIETGVGYGNWLHGEAVAAGMMMAADLSLRLGWLAAADVARIESLIRRAGLPVAGPDLPSDRYLELMRLDKKVTGGHLRLILLEAIGAARIHVGAQEAEIRAAIEARSGHA